MAMLANVSEHAGDGVSNWLCTGNLNMGVFACGPHVSLGHGSNGGSELFGH